MKKSYKKVMLAFSAALLLASCGGATESSSSSASVSVSENSKIEESTVSTYTPKAEANYIFTVFDSADVPMKGALLKLKGDAGSYEGNIGRDGILRMTIPEGIYDIDLEGLAEGYSYKNKVKTEYGVFDYDIIVKSGLRNDSPAPGEVYSAGMLGYDWELTDVAGETHVLSEMLQEYKVVILNAFYIECGYCYYEFPYLNRYVENHSDEVACLAFTCHPRDTLSAVREYQQEMGLTFPVCIEDGSLCDLVVGNSQTSGYPTTVLIDRYGYVAGRHVGMMNTDSQWKKFVDPLLDEDYVPNIM